MRYLQLLLILIPVPVLSAVPADEVVTTTAKRYFGDAVIAGGARAEFPFHLIADLNGDGEDDLIVALTDEETSKRGEGCYALGIVNSYHSAHPPEAPTFHEYDCFKGYKLETLESVSVKLREITKFRFRPVGPCIRLTLKYDAQPLICWVAGQYGTF
jgi:hypothetical protein